MIIVYHQNNTIVEVQFSEEIDVFANKSIAQNLFEIAEKYPEHLIVWCLLELKSNLNIDKLEIIFHNRRIMASYNLSQYSFLPDTIGYIDESLFVNVKKDVTYPTWKMSSDVGGIHASVLKALKNEIKADLDFEYFLHSMAKLAMINGLFCYSEPLLVKGFSTEVQKHNIDYFLLFRFVKHHYKTRWIFLLFLNLFLYEKKIAVFPLFASLFYKQRSINENALNTITFQSSKKIIDQKKIDIIIPTIGRKKYLYDFLKDLSRQTLQPKNVIIIEQNPDLDSISELDFINTENWPFCIKHQFINQAGACNARNLALEKVENEWVFMADDDIRIQDDFLEKAFDFIKTEGVEQVTFGCYEVNYPENKKEEQIIQWDGFGSGCSIVKTKNIKGIFYNMSFEFGYGEDNDFGAQLRNAGFNIIYSPKPEIVHLKAPVGGFRTKPVLAWHRDTIQPKPSPTVMLYKISNLKKQQLNGYKTVLFFKFYKHQKIKNPIKYLSSFRKQWESSLFWAEKLKQ
ncbi:GT2 family glycosyltransferase [Flavobacterium nitrogenifigens]|uniref:GT2 family glycosyltransferase n=2 Tax=Flavobacterium TaxID=237 RepID=A0A7W7J0H6_9FLAO|nr:MULTISPECIES: glycosyltransferase family A protein [Flavobacterium]MBB4803638.1 GT2 family glycosyltransferase [Flavobacterium nitrogenifigens]MBB6388557.1 GT2 family glycosyltransferase [Flavobacterium notoginsengisoli]